MMQLCELSTLRAFVTRLIYAIQLFTNIVADIRPSTVVLVILKLRTRLETLFDPGKPIV